MGDKNRSEIQKPVKNTLLSGASHGFPFENFQGSSLLIPVTQDSPSVLNDSVGDANKLSSKEFSNSESLAQMTEAAGKTALESTASTNESKNTRPTASQGYSGIFSSFFSGGSQKKQEPDFTQNQQKNSDRSSASPIPSQTQPSPHGVIPPVETFSPALQVSATVSGRPQVDALSTSSVGASFTPFSQPQDQPRSTFERLPTASKNPSVPLLFPNTDDPIIAKELNQPEQNQVQSFFNKDNTPTTDLGFKDKTSTVDIGFESFYNAAPESVPSSASLKKTQSDFDLTGGFSDRTLSNPTFSTNSVQPSNSALHQTFTGSSDSVAHFQPPTVGAPSTLSAPLAAPPISLGATARNYRRDHHKRFTYAPVPGLTSDTAISSSYLQPRENLSSPKSLSSSALISPSAVIKEPLSSSLSQPSLNVSETMSGSDLLPNNSLASTTSLHNFFSSHSTFPALSESSQTTVPSADSFLTETPVPPFYSNSHIVNNQNFTSAIPSNVHISHTSNVRAPPPPGTGSVYIASPHAVHPSIMSTREQTQTLIPTTHSETIVEPATIIPASLEKLANMGSSGTIYRPVYHHWFIRTETKDSKEIWQPFSMSDSLALEQAFNSETLTPQTVVSTDGGRYDVNVTNRIRTSVYWEEEPKTVRRCSWFFKSTIESRLHPYDENTAYHLEEEFKKAVTTNTWNRKVDLPTGDYVILHGPNSMDLYQNAPQTPEGWEAETNYVQTEQRRPKIVKRGVLDDFDIEEGESPIIDHLMFVVHGIGSVCDFRFRTIEEAVDGFRAKSLQLIKSHFRDSVEEGIVNRVEVLPVSWHNHLHGENTGVDKKLQTITLKSIPRLRHFTNDTLLDILFYTSPVYCQNIVQQVGREINTLYEKFKIRNPNFTGGVSLVGHSLGSVILFDMLCHQKPPSPRMNHIQEESKTTIIQHDVTTVVSPDKKKRSLSRNVSYVIGNAGTGQPFIEYPQLSFQPFAFFALGSPIGMFVTVRGIDSLGLDFCLPTCSRFFNVFHPFDPVAYRIEALINPDLAEKRPVLIPHHKGRKRMHLELKETMARVGADLKQRLVDSVRSTWNTVYQLTMFGRADDGLEEEVDKVIEKQLERQRTESVGNGVSECEETDFNTGRLNQGRRIDYVLQEAPLESFNEYVSALTSHVIYWNSEDTILLILKEMYGSMGISTDNQNNNIHGSQDLASPSMEIPGNILSNTSPKQSSSYGFK